MSSKESVVEIELAKDEVLKGMIDRQESDERVRELPAPGARP